METEEKITAFLNKQDQWKACCEALFDILHQTSLVECVKWGIPTYTYQSKNIVGIVAFKSYVGLWFYQGVFLADTEKKLVNAQEEKTKGLRQWRFYGLTEIEKEKSNILAYIYEAVENQKQGKEIKINRTKVLEIPEALEKQFSENQDLKKKFDSFTFSKQKEFCSYIVSPKTEKTRNQHLDKVVELIMKEKGLYDQYKK